MDKLYNGKPYEQMDDLGGGFTPLFLVQHPYDDFSHILRQPLGSPLNLHHL